MSESVSLGAGLGPKWESLRRLAQRGFHFGRRAVDRLGRLPLSTGLWLLLAVLYFGLSFLLSYGLARLDAETDARRHMVGRRAGSAIASDLADAAMPDADRLSPEEVIRIGALWREATARLGPIEAVDDRLALRVRADDGTILFRLGRKLAPAALPGPVGLARYPVPGRAFLVDVQSLPSSGLSIWGPGALLVFLLLVPPALLALVLGVRNRWFVRAPAARSSAKTADDGTPHTADLTDPAITPETTADEVTDRVCLAGLLEGLPDGLAVWDQDGALVAANGRFMRIIGLDPEEVEGEARALLSAAPEAIERDGRWYCHHEIALPSAGTLSVLRDVTSEILRAREIHLLHKELETRGQEIERLQEMPFPARALPAVPFSADSAEADASGFAPAQRHAMEDFMANASHELRTPLNAILGFSEIMKKEMFGPLGDGKYREYADDIHSSGRKLLTMVDDILHMARLDGGEDVTLEPRRLDPVALIEGTLQLIRQRIEGKGIELIIEARPQPRVFVDAAATKRILLHLLSNALKFTPAGGSITVRMKADLRRVHIHVEDTGIGIDPEDLPDLGRPFSRSRRAIDQGVPGLGLGLALSMDLARANGGQLDLSNAQTGGTIAHLVLPRRGRGSAEPATPSGDEGPDGEAMRQAS